MADPVPTPDPLREQLLPMAHALGADELAAFELLIGDVQQALTFRYGSTAQLRHGDLVQVVAPEKSSFLGMVGFCVDSEDYRGIPDVPDAGGVPVIFTYAGEHGGVRLVGRIARARLRRVGNAVLVPDDIDPPHPLDGVVTIPDKDELAAAAGKRVEHA